MLCSKHVLIQSVVLIFFLMAISAGCKTPRRWQNAAGLKIGGGHNLGKQDESTPVVMLSLNRGGMFESCTGVFIDERVILTAAHCLVDRAGGSVLDANKINIKPHFVAVDFVTIDTNYLNGNLSEQERQAHDLGAVFIKSPQDEGSAWIKNLSRMVNEGMSPGVGETIEVVGYGKIRSTEKYTEDTPRRGFNKLDAVNASYLEFGSRINSVSGGDLPVDVPADDAAALSGDSGGPVMWNHILVGISVYGRHGLGAGRATISEAKSRAINLAGPIAQNFLSKISVLKNGSKEPQ